MKLWTPWAASGASAAITTSWKAAVIRRRRIEGVIFTWTSITRTVRADIIVLAVQVVVCLVVSRRQPRQSN
eukprot:8259741-Heterocapsa_arctica.AAC.1